MSGTDLMRMPNHDLIGYTFRLDGGGLGRVSGTAPWSEQYVLVECLREDAEGEVQRSTTTRLASQVRRARELDSMT